MSRIVQKKSFMQKIWWVWPCFYIFFRVVFFPYENPFNYRMPSARLSLSCFFVLFFKCFRGFGFVHFVSFFLFTSFLFFLYSHATHLSLQNLVCGFKTVPCTGMHTFFTAFEVRFVSTLKEPFVFVPSNPLFSHIFF